MLLGAPPATGEGRIRSVMVCHELEGGCYRYLKSRLPYTKEYVPVIWRSAGGAPPSQAVC